MMCTHFRRSIHDLLDERLDPKDLSRFRQHLEECSDCRLLQRDLQRVRDALSIRSHLPETAQNQIWSHLQYRRHRTFSIWFLEGVDRFWTYWRDLESSILWTRIGALPLTALCFVLILAQFSRVEFQEWSYPLVRISEVSGSPADTTLVTRVQARQPTAQVNGLVDTLWGMPFEDSLSLVAEISPDGRAVIDDVLEYPKSWDLLSAIDMTLRSGQFDSADRGAGRFVIYSFQKIDVYEDRRGL